MCRLIFFPLLILILLSCQNKREPRSHRENIFRTSFKTDPTGLDPRKNGDPCTSCINFLIYEGLTQIDKEGNGIPALAESVETLNDGKTYIFHLREAYWSDGSPITAVDFERSWKKIADPAFASPCPHLLFPIKNVEKSISGKVPFEAVGVRAIDNKTLEVELENPIPYFLSLITFCNFFPIPSHIEQANPLWDQSPADQIVVSGPFKIVRWERNKEIALEKNPLYWNEKEIRLEKIHISIVSDQQTAVRMFEQGDLDYVSSAQNFISMEDLAENRRKGNLRVAIVGGSIFITFNMDRFPFNNRNIRKALALAIDRDLLAANIAELSEASARRIISPALFNHREKGLFPEYDPEFALAYLNAGLAELGIPLDAIAHSLSMSYESKDLHQKLALAIQQQWKEVLGIDVKLQMGDQVTILKKHMSRDYQIGLDYCYAQYHDPSSILDRFKYKSTKKNLPGFEDSEYIRLLNEASQNIHPARRFEVLERAEGILASELPVVPLLYTHVGVLVSPDLANVEFSPIGNLLIKNITTR